MPIGPIEAVRVFTTNLTVARRFYAERLGLRETLATDKLVIFDTGSGCPEPGRQGYRAACHGYIPSYARRQARAKFQG